MPDTIKRQIERMYNSQRFIGAKLFKKDELAYHNYRDSMKEKEYKIILAIKEANPSLGEELEQAFIYNKLDALKRIGSRIEVEYHPNGDELYKLDGEEFLKITREITNEDYKVSIIQRFELI